MAHILLRGEISDDTNQSKAFSFFPLCLNLGGLIAAFLGGTFAQPHKKFPRLVAALPIFKTYPYLLPNLLAAVFPITAALLAFLYLKETLPPPKVVTTSHDDDDSETTQTGQDGEEAEFKYSDLFSHKINSIMFSFGVLSLMGTAMGGLIPLYCFTPVPNGGLGFDATQIGNAMSARAVSTIVIQLGAFPYLQRRVGTLRLYRFLLILWIPAFLGLPLLNILARKGEHVGVWVGLVLTFACGSIANMAFGKSPARPIRADLSRLITLIVCNLLLVNEAAPSRRSLGAINGESQFPFDRVHR